MITNFSKKKSHTAYRSILFAFLGIVLLFLWVILLVANIKMYRKGNVLNYQVSNLENKVQDIQTENDGLKQGIAMSENTAYIEKVAREELGLQKSGEVVVSFIVPKNQEEEQKNESKSAFSVWFSWVGGGFSAFLDNF